MQRSKQFEYNSMDQREGNQNSTSLIGTTSDLHRFDTRDGRISKSRLMYDNESLRVFYDFEATAMFKIKLL